LNRPRGQLPQEELRIEGDADNLLERLHPLFNIAEAKVLACQKHFADKPLSS
jgi:hypothetical protein